MPKQFRGKLADPEWRRERARRAGVARQSLDAHIAAVVRRAPALTPEQIARLRAVLADPMASGTPAAGENGSAAA